MMFKETSKDSTSSQWLMVSWFVKYVEDYVCIELMMRTFSKLRLYLIEIEKNGYPSYHDFI